MKKRILLIALSFLLLVTGACMKQIRLTTNDPITLFILSNRGNPDEMNERQFQYRNEVGEYMEANLANLFNRAGYEVRLIEDREEYIPAHDSYLLIVSIVSYNPGSAAARILVGAGVGAASLTNKYELYGEDDYPLLHYNDGAGSGSGWRDCVLQLNRRALERVTNKINTIKQNEQNGDRLEKRN